MATPIPKGARAWNIDKNVSHYIWGHIKNIVEINNRHSLLFPHTHADTYWLPVRWQHVQGCHRERWVLQSTVDRTLPVCLPKKWHHWHPTVGWRQSSNSSRSQVSEPFQSQSLCLDRQLLVQERFSAVYTIHNIGLLSLWFKSLLYVTDPAKRVMVTLVGMFDWFSQGKL